MSLGSWLRTKLAGFHTSETTVRGFRVTVINTRPDVQTAHVLSRVDLALGLLEQYVPHHVRRMRRDFSRILVQRYACRGAYFPDDRSCMVELTFTVNPTFGPAQIGATILHEAMHARLDRMGYRSDDARRAREERFCRRAEIEFGQMIPGGDAVVERALSSLRGTDAEVAHIVDFELAAQRVAQADLDAMKAPAWMKRAIARRRGLQA